MLWAGEKIDKKTRAGICSGEKLLWGIALGSYSGELCCSGELIKMRRIT
ncbi:MAG TPA: hypothetical protein P5543_06040 [Planctomycetota bacterium]|nr:hypothetical protein [Planctomycetota bacterium]HRU51734.1 hypothetical protein [Planctomycetota bacterium]